MKDYRNIVIEAKDYKTLKTELKELINSDSKAQKFLREYKKDENKIVDFIDYLLGKHSKKLEDLMKKTNTTYDELMNEIGKVK